ncbi:Hat2p [Ascoidea rubescens DSM 1968]|uniref:Histone acetyltransferase subunit n=1 Tax=Ascoidea rubescens DSM 1968 TaxID=1344418 RepID=A0A1D2VA32_9ASCO|nr:histone acetyltransferase subunit [Ascoidea rubescens DSM 1968]ODV58520.1 histone acetyltransferase subunit [Ascoidea rubescens DSM 1968]
MEVDNEDVEKPQEKADGEEEMSIEDEYKMWKENSSLMYKYVSQTALTWPSLSIQWLPSIEINKENETIKTQLIIGSDTSGSEDDFLKIASKELPLSIIDDKLKNETTSGFKINKRFKHKTEINRARYMPQNPQIIATISGSGNSYIYVNSAKKSKNRKCILSLKYHKKNGFGLSWNPNDEGKLLTSADDSKICLWDINSKNISVELNNTPTSLQPSNVLNDHTDIVNDVKWHNFNENLFGSVSDDKNLFIYDVRTLSTGPVLKKTNAHHNDGINSLSFSNFSTNLLATGSLDSTIGLFDLRNIETKLHLMVGHKNAITSLEWSPHQDGFLASGSEDRRVIIWDISKIGEEQNQDDADDGAPELFMMHAGHTALVTDISWHPDKRLKWLLASTANDNIIQLWKVKNKISDPVDGIETTLPDSFFE